MAIKKLLKNFKESLLFNTKIDIYEDSGIFYFEFHGEISPFNLVIIGYYSSLLSSNGYVCSIYSSKSNVILRIKKYD